MEASAGWYELDGTAGPDGSLLGLLLLSGPYKIMLIYLGAPSDAAIMPIQNVYQENKQLKQLMRGRAGKPA